MPQLVEGRTGTLPDGTRVVVRRGANGQLAAVPVGGDPVAPAGGQAPAGLTRLPDGSLVTPPGPRGGAPRRVAGLSVQEQKALADIRARAAVQRTDLADTERFARLAEEQDTGGLFAIPILGDALASGAVALGDEQVDEMREISARLTPQQRPAGSGATSDFEQRLYGRSVPAVGRTEGANQAVIDRGRSRAGESQRRAEFFDWYASRNGTLQGAEQAWNNIYRPPPVGADSPEPRANVRPTQAQRDAVNRANQEGARNPRAVLGSRENPRVPPEGFNVATLPDGDWYYAPDGRLTRAGRERANGELRDRSNSRGGPVISVRRVQ